MQAAAREIYEKLQGFLAVPIEAEHSEQLYEEDLREDEPVVIEESDWRGTCFRSVKWVPNLEHPPAGWGNVGDPYAVIFRRLTFEEFCQAYGFE